MTRLTAGRASGDVDSGSCEAWGGSGEWEGNGLRVDGPFARGTWVASESLESDEPCAPVFGRMRPVGICSTSDSLADAA